MNYIDNQIFTDNRLNILADRLFYYLNQEYTFLVLKSKFALSGKVAALLQLEGIPPSTNIIFKTNDIKVYDYLLLNVNDFMKPKTIVKFKERILLDFDYCQVEIWYRSGELKIMNHNTSDIYIEVFDEIEPILL